MTYTIKNQPKDLFNIPGSYIFEVVDFHVALYPGTRHITVFPLHEKDRFKKTSPDFGFIHTIDSYLKDLKLTLDEIKKNNVFPSLDDSLISKKQENWVGSQIIAKVQMTPKGWSTQINNKKLRKAPLFLHQMEPFLIFEMDVKTYAIFANSLIKSIKNIGEYKNVS